MNTVVRMVLGAALAIGLLVFLGMPASPVGTPIGAAVLVLLAGLLAWNLVTGGARRRDADRS